jgi:acyl-CoA thioesterase-1
VIALVHEVPFRIGPAPPSGPPPRTLVVLGDSLSAGGYGETRTWTRILAEDDGLDVRDLSRDGQTVAKAVPEAEALFSAAPGSESLDAAVVLIELGGNDVLGESTLAAYESSLERLLTLCRGEPLRPRTVVMLEIPGVAGRWGFAAAQRRLAARHGVVLAPKRVLANVVFARGSTSADALHLTDQGQRRFAEALRPWLHLGASSRPTS